MGYIKLPYEGLKAFCTDVFKGYGFIQEESEEIVDVLLRADLYGIESHGVQRLIRYHKAVTCGDIDPKVKPEIIHETPISAIIDSKGGVGQTVAMKAMRMAIEKAKNIGAGFVMVKNANHYGIASYYADMAADADMIGLSFTNSEAIMVPTFGRRAMIGSNPIAIAMPADPIKFSFDAATTVAPRGKLEVYNKKEQPLPHGWAVDANGKETSNAAEVLYNIIHKVGGGILPLGGSQPINGSHKGYGYGMMCEIFTSILAGGATSNHCCNGGNAETSQGFIAIDYGMFGDKKEIRARMSTFLQELRDSDKAEGQDRIYTHGEKEVESTKEKLADGIPVNEKTDEEMRMIADTLHLDYSKYFK